MDDIIEDDIILGPPVNVPSARFFTRRGRPVVEPVTCPCTNPDEEQFNFPNLPKVFRDGALPCEFELPTAGDVEWLLFSYT